MSKNTENSVILSTAYFPPVQYMSKFVRHPSVFIERRENYESQSYRNRAVVSGANGLMKLTVPVKKSETPKVPIQDVKIDYSTDWQKVHWRAIKNAYKSSPFFEFYQDAFLPFFEDREVFLIDLNTKILQTLLQEIELSADINFTDSFLHEFPGKDFRFTIHPKKSRQKPDADFAVKAYTQVFSDRFDFFSNLSILDLLFNQGPNTENFLRACVVF